MSHAGRHPASGSHIERYRKTRLAMLARAKTMTDKPVGIPESIAQIIGPDNTAALRDDAAFTREWRAIHNRDEVLRLSIDGISVADIASALNLSYRHVVTLRAHLGVGRRR